MQDFFLEEIKDGKEIIAIILRADYVGENGARFFTPEDYSQQLGYIKHPAGKKISAHAHKLVVRKIKRTQEVLLIKSGKVQVDFYTTDKQYLESTILNKGDVIALASGGHGFEMLEDTEMIEVKQGPYAGMDDKDYF